MRNCYFLAAVAPRCTLSNDARCGVARIRNLLIRRLTIRVLVLAVSIVCLSGGWRLEAHEDSPPKPAPKQQTKEATPPAHAHPQPHQEALPPGHAHPEAGAQAESGMPADMHHDAKQHEHAAGTPAHEHAAAASEHEHASSTPSAPLVRSLLVLTLAIAAGLLIFTRQSLRRNVAPAGLSKENLLDRPVIGKILRSRAFLYALIFPTLAVFTVIVVTGLWGEQNTGNPSVLLTWILWWPAVIFTFFILGRIWCAFCPFGYLGDLAQKIFSFRLKVPMFLRNMWWRLAFFVGLTWATTLWALDRWPKGTAWLALGETIGAVVLAIIFEKRAFCRFVCPVGGIFGLYSMTAPVRLGNKDPMVCYHKCPQKNCFASCAWFQYPPTVDRNAECTLCMECVRACPHDNITLHAQPFGGDLMQFQSRRKSIDEAVAIAVVMGVALLQTAVMLNRFPEWQAAAGNFLHIAPGRLLYTILFVVFGMVIPVALVSVVTYLGRPTEKAYAGFWGAFRAYAFAFLPLGLALHSAHNFHHLFGEGSAMWHGLKKAVAGYAGWAVPASATVPWTPGPNMLFTMQWVALLAGLYLAFRVGTALVRRNAPLKAFRAALPVLIFATAYTVLNLVILSSAMAHRH